MPHESSPDGVLRRFLRQRPILATVLTLVVADIFALTLMAALRTFLGIVEWYALGVVMALLGVAAIGFGIWLRNYHGGFAIFVGVILLLGAVLFPAMYASQPELFPDR
jgi:hypothetical protein